MPKLATAKQSALPFTLFCSVLLIALVAHSDLLSSKLVTKTVPTLKISNETPAKPAESVVMVGLKQS